ncbi:ATPase/histidine kinase/DNA gyrase B/HSP90 domain protein [uncultured Desulfatiglans sp.]|uniref:histidine kinase n=1 Tax=Uncultured Desulfatiglans sp. TaxID=1748965 RepID=A0A653A556_UNCDX|nr:ATPase/histidine kinase/DNA gyrase B/HSP90 domain protein [uncultured Desulfatiglans sp.]
MKMFSESGKLDYHSLVINRILTTVLVSVIPMVLAAGVIFYQFRTSYQEKVRAHLTTLMKKHKERIDTFLNERLGNIRFLSHRCMLEASNQRGFMEETLAALQRDIGPIYVDLGLVDDRGMQVAYAGPYRLGGAHYADAEWFRQAMQNDYVISDVFLGLRGLPHFIVAVKKTWQEKDWVLRATIDFGAFNTLVENIRIGETGFAFILNREGQFQTKPLFEVAAASVPYKKMLSAEVREDEVQILEMKDDYGQENLYASAFLKGGDWLLVYQQRTSEAFADIRRTLNVTAIIILLGALASITLAVVRVKTMARRLEEADREKEMMNDQIVEAGKLASVGELAAGIAHEINNPVAIMAEEAGWIEDLLEDVPPDLENLTEIQRALKQIRTQGKRCKEITHKLLSFARRTDSTVREVDLGEIVEEIVEISAQRARYSNATIHTEIEETLPRIQASSTEIQQVFLNLINNALDAMEKTGGRIDITGRSDGKDIVFEIADTGSGIPAANLNKIFDPFFTTKQVGKGTGLGLSICYGIIRKMGGEITVQSRVDEGTRFTIRIPVMTPVEDSKRGNGFRRAM